MFSSESQERLFALMGKAVDLVPCVSDAECDTFFVVLASFCEGAVQKRDKLKMTMFERLDVESLIKLAKDIRRESEETLDREGKKRDRSEAESSIPRWTFENAYNIVKVTCIEESPFRIFVKSRPPVAGNQKPLDYCLESQDFAEISALKGKKAKKLKENLISCLEDYCTSDFPVVVISHLNTTEWGKDFAAKLELRRK
jgi:hypothetical protein